MIIDHEPRSLTIEMNRSHIIALIRLTCTIIIYGKVYPTFEEDAE